MKLPLLAAACIVVIVASADAQQPLTGMDRLKAIHCGTPHNPCPPPPPPTPVLNFSPPAPSEPDTAPAGTLISQIIVTMSDGSSFSGSLGFGPPYSSDAGFCAIQGSDVILGMTPPPGSSQQICTITATTP